MELLLALCRACSIADEILSAGEALPDMGHCGDTVLPQEPGLYMSQVPPYSQSWDRVSLARLFFRVHGVGWAAQRQGLFLLPWALPAGLVWGLWLNHLCFG